uniref:Uncharacterized protein n=1 Tax=Cafeteria roenbergensis TaxID=33653 RepID=A0A7S0K8Z8_CAFRO
MACLGGGRQPNPDERRRRASIREAASEHRRSARDAKAQERLSQACFAARLLGEQQQARSCKADAMLARARASARHVGDAHAAAQQLVARNGEAAARALAARRDAARTRRARLAMLRGTCEAPRRPCVSAPPLPRPGPRLPIPTAWPPLPADTKSPQGCPPQGGLPSWSPELVGRAQGRRKLRVVRSEQPGPPARSACASAAAADQLPGRAGVPSGSAPWAPPPGSGGREGSAGLATGAGAPPACASATCAEAGPRAARAAARRTSRLAEATAAARGLDRLARMERGAASLLRRRA